jgi:GDPmannose 4,6-dehydratase
LQAREPDDYVVATGTSYTVRDFVQMAFEHVGLDWERYVEIDPRYHRPSEVDSLIGDSSKASGLLGWKAQTLVPDLVKIMVEADLEAVR